MVHYESFEQNGIRKKTHRHEERKKQKKCATFSRTIELSYPNNNLDNTSMPIVPVTRSHTSHSVCIENLPIEIFLSDFSSNTFNFIFFLDFQLNCSDLDLSLQISSIIWLHNKTKIEKNITDERYPISVEAYAYTHRDMCMIFIGKHLDEKKRKRIHVQTMSSDQTQRRCQWTIAYYHHHHR